MYPQSNNNLKRKTHNVSTTTLQSKRKCFSFHFFVGLRIPWWIDLELLANKKFRFASKCAYVFWFADGFQRNSLLTLSYFHVTILTVQERWQPAVQPTLNLFGTRRLKLYLYSNGQCIYVSTFMKGETDHQLQWPFEHHVTYRMCLEKR